MSSPASVRAAAAVAARRRRTDDALHRVRQAIAALRRGKVRVSVAAVARRAAVSRTFLYDNPHARAAIAAALAEADEPGRQLLATQEETRDGSWRERALNAEDALKHAHAEISRQRSRIGELLGQIRDVQAEGTDDSVARITVENATLIDQ